MTKLKTRIQTKPYLFSEHFLTVVADLIGVGTANGLWVDVHGSSYRRTGTTGLFFSCSRLRDTFSRMLKILTVFPSCHLCVLDGDVVEAVLCFKNEAGDEMTDGVRVFSLRSHSPTQSFVGRRLPVSNFSTVKVKARPLGQSLCSCHIVGCRLISIGLSSDSRSRVALTHFVQRLRYVQ